MEKGQTPSVLAVSWGKGDPQTDAISLVFLDDGGRLREHSKLDNLSDDDTKKEFEGLLQRRSPDVIVVGGFTVQTMKLMGKLREIVGAEPSPGDVSGANTLTALGGSQTGEWGTANGTRGPWNDSIQGGSGYNASRGSDWGGWNGGGGGGGSWAVSNHPDASNGQGPRPGSPGRQRQGSFPVVYVHDDSARIYQHSKRASEEFSALSLTAKYCVGLARYTQSPMNEYAALGRDMAAITYDEDSQQLVNRCLTFPLTIVDRQRRYPRRSSSLH